MADGAEVRSLEQLENYSGQLEHARARLMAEIEYLSLELRRLTNWLENDVLGYWTDECVKADRAWMECRDALSRCMSYVREDEKRPCTEEKKRLHKAELRRELCQQKLKVTKSAISFWEAERSKQHTKVQRCRDMAEADMLVARKHLQDQLQTLASYTSLRSTAFSLASASEKPIKADAVEHYDEDTSPATEETTE